MEPQEKAKNKTVGIIANELQIAKLNDSMVFFAMAFVSTTIADNYCFTKITLILVFKKCRHRSSVFSFDH